MWTEAGKPTYEVRAWREHGWWMARVVGAGDGANAAPINAVSHAPTLDTVEQAARTVVATILDVAHDAFDIELEYVLPPVLDNVVCEAIGARTWLEAARELWWERSTVAVRTLAAEGLTVRETATLLGLNELDTNSYSEAT
jgi:hypothetical protein